MGELVIVTGTYPTRTAIPRPTPNDSERAAWSACSRLMQDYGFEPGVMPHKYDMVVWRNKTNVLYFEFANLTVFGILPDENGPGEFHVYDNRRKMFFEPFFFENSASPGEEPYYNKIVGTFRTRKVQ